MFPAPLHTRHERPLWGTLDAPQVAGDRTSVVPAALRLAGLTLLLATALSQSARAQASGTLQVTAHVLPAAASWSAWHEARAAIQALRRDPSAGSTVRRSGLVRTSAELQEAGSRRRLVVTLQHPHN